MLYYLPTKCLYAVHPFDNRVGVSRHCAVCLVIKSCLTLCDPMDCSSPDSSVHGMCQARTLEWVAISSSRRYSRPRDLITSLASPEFAVGFFIASTILNSKQICSLLPREFSYLARGQKCDWQVKGVTN
ncbi:unnamed protein product [Rangifer tarandus platyrhynchus]|uniref:Uncharacterized protein n=1 Tax=Rangifer tarandus platyrhynchus TaxID=3082113 RepID=A0ABN8ZY21_RANTA|nr:unnamed protein product [Rangifer tarandus platyrhynchus]